MKLTEKLIENVIKISFSIVLFQLLFIAIGAQSGDFSTCDIREMLEYPSAAATLAIGGGLLLEYIQKNEAK